MTLKVEPLVTEGMARPIRPGDIMRARKVNGWQRKQSGFTYLGLLVAIVIIGILLAKVGIDWSQASRRGKEADLLFVGNEYRKAIMLYYVHTPGPVKKYPAKLKDLLLDRRYASTRRYLRKLYRDPVTNSAKWALVMSPEGGIVGVHSLSKEKPIKVGGFPLADADFKNSGSYSDWVFSYTPPVVTSSLQSQ